jgi:DnaK suppressor protein
MARRDALLRLHKTLLARRDDLRKKLRGELANMREFRSADSSSDPADVAFETGSDEMSSQLAEFDARELNHIDRALARLKQGTYGLCEACQAKIPVTRLNALPYTTYCIECQREMERYPDWAERRGGVDWEKVYDASATPLEEQREVNLSEIEMDLSSNR